MYMFTCQRRHNPGKVTAGVLSAVVLWEIIWHLLMTSDFSVSAKTMPMKMVLKVLNRVLTPHHIPWVHILAVRWFNTLFFFGYLSWGKPPCNRYENVPVAPAWFSLGKVKSPLSSPRPYARPVNQNELFKARNSDFIQKASRLRRWWTSVPKNHDTQVRIQASFLLKGERLQLVGANFLRSEYLFLQMST